ncbi:ABC transporter permease/substrate-binding protein [Sphingomonas colocasiae]|uniref:ABC transporter permease/substrate-binding protein n=1 Tax=Sphingomonas colocasiae TaxID=1848973 RepID=A0ABS7PXP4_9SPHN|nr:ABC transporter permease/substrate-binding protein [Sphingomonas colocasiae]MBY8825420.1 ABC transporter permease/substrate-binding protein [Sphingomonas colocasiae]
MNEALARLPGLLAAHVLLSAAALVLALAVSLPLAVIAARRPAVARVALAAASLIQTIPALALLALFYPILLGLSALVGAHIPALGFLPSLLALTLYALLPILRNAVTGLTSLDPAVIEAADGVGMTPGQKLRLVEAPLAAPVVMAGIRTAAVWTIGAATLSTTVGQPGLGDLIFAGLQTQDWTLVLTGCLASAALALIADALLGLIALGLAKRRRLAVWIGFALLAGGTIAAALPRLLPAPARDTVVIGAKNFSEQYILARLIGERLTAAGYAVEYREGLGSAVIFRALAAGDIDVYVDYSGTLWTNEMKRGDVPARGAMIAAIGDWARREHGVELVGPMGFENAYALAVRGADAKRLGLRTIDDLARVSAGMTLGADLEFLDRPEWAMLRRAYPLHFAAQRAYSPTFMFRALESGQADVISAFSSDGRIAAMQLTVLADPKGAIPGYDALLLAAPRRAGDERFLAAIRPLANAIPVETMREANYRVDRDADKQSPEAAARWLQTRIRH